MTVAIKSSRVQVEVSPRQQLSTAGSTCMPVWSECKDCSVAATKAKPLGTQPDLQQPGRAESPHTATCAWSPAQQRSTIRTVTKHLAVGPELCQNASRDQTPYNLACAGQQ